MGSVDLLNSEQYDNVQERNPTSDRITWKYIKQRGENSASEFLWMIHFVYTRIEVSGQLKTTFWKKTQAPVSVWSE